MIAVDTNLLVYAHRADSPFNGGAYDCIRDLAENPSPWAIPWPCLHEFVAIVTHPRIYRPASTIRQAVDQVSAWLASPSLVLIGESGDHWSRMAELLLASDIRGGKVHDARIAAICGSHAVRELLSADRDFSRFPSLKTRNPLS